MTETVERLARLTPEKRRLLLAQLEKAKRAAPRAPSGSGPRAERKPISLAEPDRAAAGRLLAEDGVEDVYPLSALQQGILFHSLYNPGSGEYVEQFSITLSGPLDAAALRRAFERLVGRHPCLRTACVWDGLVEPLQVVRREVELPWRQDDWREAPENEIAKRLESELLDDVRRGFELERAPLLRIRLIRTGERRWRFVWCCHHLVLDGWSLIVVLRELFALYEACRLGTEPALAERPLYRDYIAWLRGRDRSAAETYWRRSLGGTTGPTLLGEAAGRRRAAAAPDDHRVCRRYLGAETVAALDALSRRRQLTLNVLLQGAWGLLLARSTGAADVLFGLTVSGRSASPSWVEPMVGMFINTLPVRLRPAAGAPFLPWLAALRAGQSELLEHEDSPLDQVRRWSGLPAGQPMFDTILVSGSFPVAASLGRVRGLELGDLRLFDRTSYPLTVDVMPGAELEVRLSYAASRFDRTTVQRLSGHLGTLLRGFAVAPRRLGEIPWLAPAERHQLLAEWNDTRAGLDPRQRVYSDLLADQVDRSPEAVAAVVGEELVSYRELARRADRLARRLAELGVGPETVVALLAERGIEFLTAVLAVLEAGGAYLPLDPRHPPERHRRVLEESRASLLMVAGDASGVLGEVLEGQPGISLPEWAGTLAGRAGPAHPREPDGAAAPARLAYVIYTSGSTGVPKGAMVTQRGMLNHLAAKVRDLDLGPRDRVAQTASQCFDISVWQLLAPLAVGARVVVYGDEVAHDPGRLLARVRRDGISILEVVPSVMRMLLPESEGAPPPLPALRWLIPTGEALPPELCRRWRRAFPRIPLVNAYGPTECSDDVSHHFLRGPLGDEATVPIGRPIPNLRLHVLTADSRPLPVGVAGELGVAGDGVGRGYLRDPRRTAAAFVPDPFAAAGRLYLAGDLARRTPAGVLEFLGRVDQQVKVRGFRVELEEIEVALGRHDDVDQAVVVAREDPSGSRSLAAWVVPDSGRRVDESKLASHLRETLPDYMVPAYFLTLDALPLSANGKVDRAALGRLPLPAADRPRSRDAPRTPSEELMAAIWAEVLEVEAVGRNEDFFGLGGHSLLAARVISRIRRRFGVELPLRDLFQAPTVAGLARRVAAAAASRLPPITPLPRGAPLPLSLAQERLWLLHSLDPESPAYNMPGALRIRGSLDPVHLQAAADGLVRRHESLRTTFPEIGGRPLQLVAPVREFPLPVVDLEHLGAGAREGEVRRLAAREALRPFDLSRQLPFRMHLLRLTRDDHAVFFNVHHIVSDAWSMDLLVRDLAALYRGEKPPPLPIGYADFAVWQRRCLEGLAEIPGQGPRTAGSPNPKGAKRSARRPQDPGPGSPPSPPPGDVLADQRRWWQQELAGAPRVLDLPTDRPRPPVLSYRGGVLTARVAPSLVRHLEALSRRRGATLFMTLLAAFQVLLSRSTGQRDLLVGSPIAGRNHADVEELIGFFVNTLLLRADLTGEPTFGRFLEDVRERTLAAYSHQDLPFERLVEELRPERDLSRSPLFQVMLAFQNEAAAELELPGLTASFPDLDVKASKFDLTLVLTPASGGLAAALEYASDLFDETTVERLWRRYGRLLAEVAADPDRPVTEPAPLAAAERHQVVAEWNDSARSYAGGACLHELVAAQADRTPESSAVVFGERHLSYRALGRRVRGLARHLSTLGVGPEVVVGVAAERSLELIVGLLAVLEAGGAYLPLDPEDPAERLAYMVETSGAPVLLTQERFAAALPERRHLRVALLDAPLPEPGEGVAGPAPGLDNLAYVIFTSGSTGRPKGSMIAHRGIVNRLRWMLETYPLGPGEGVLHKTPFTFDVSVWEIFWPLAAGGRLVVARPGGHRDSAYLADLAADRRVSALHFVPSMLQVFVDEPRLAACRALSRVIASGEALPAALAERFFARAPRPECELYNLYGPTEASVEVSFWRCRRSAASVPIGRPVANLRLHVLDRRRHPAPAGVPGELFLGGAGLARGYRGGPALTAASFVPDSLAAAPGERLYRTGDLARFDADGCVGFLGRVDHQVKLRGFRIELGEVEAALARHPAVREAVVTADERAGHLVAYLVSAAGGAPPPVERLREELAEILPAYMVPATFVHLDALPLNRSGKVDRRALPRPRGLRPALEAEYAAPRTEMERLVAEQWRAVLGVDRVGRDDSFFDLGGHSLLLARVRAGLAERLGREIPMLEMFRYHSVRALAEYLAGARRPAGDAAPDDGGGERKAGVERLRQRRLRAARDA